MTEDEFLCHFSCYLAKHDNVGFLESRRGTTRPMWNRPISHRGGYSLAELDLLARTATELLVIPLKVWIQARPLTFDRALLRDTRVHPHIVNR